MVLALAGLVLLVTGGAGVVDRYLLQSHAETTTGTIVDGATVRRGDRRAEEPVVRFVARDGQEVTIRGDVERPYAFGTRPTGSEVAVRYDPADPDHAVIDTPAERLAPLVTALLGAFGVVLGVVSLRRERVALRARRVA